MNLNHFYFVILVMGMAVSCTNRKEITNDAVKINPDEFINPPDEGEEWIESIKFIQLETKKDFFIPDDAKCKKRGDYWLIGNTDQLLIFDINGNSVGSLKSKGKGPEEFAYIGDFDLVPETEEVVICEDRNIAFYTLDGVFRGKSHIPLRPWNIAALSQDYFAFAPGRLLKGREESLGNYQLLITNRQGEIIDRKFEYPYSIVNDGDTEFRKSTNRGSSLFSLSYDQNIYEIGPGLNLSVKYRFDFGKLNPDTSYLNDESVVNDTELYLNYTGKMTKLFSVSEAGNNLIFRCGSDKHQKVAFRIINNKSGNHRSIVMNMPPLLGKFYGWPIYSYTGSTGEYLFHMLAANYVVDILDSLSDNEIIELSRQEGFLGLKNVVIDDNPILVMYKLKDF